MKNKIFHNNDHSNLIILITLGNVKKKILFKSFSGKERHIDGSRGSKPTCVILLCPCEKYVIALSSAWRSYQATLNFSHITI